MMRKHKWLALICSVVLMWTVASAAAVRTSKKSSSKTKSRASSGKKKSARKSPRRSYRSTAQRTPTQDRYRDIQEALAAKGYFTGTADGVWDASSIEAMKRFQSDQNLQPTGRINSLSLIALGLGPKYDDPPDESVEAPQTEPPAPRDPK